MTDEAVRREFDVLVTAAEAYPRLEQAFLDAEGEIVAGFRIFDPQTKLRSDPARTLGETWFDLLVSTLNRGVVIDLTLSDFDPVVRMDLHLYAWQCLQRLKAAAAASRNPQNLRARVAMHPAQVGLLPRLALWPRTIKEIRKQMDSIKDEQGRLGIELLSKPRQRELAQCAEIGAFGQKGRGLLPQLSSKVADLSNFGPVQHAVKVSREEDGLAIRLAIRGGQLGHGLVDGHACRQCVDSIKLLDDGPSRLEGYQSPNG